MASLKEIESVGLLFIYINDNGKMESIRTNYHHIDNVEEYRTPLVDLISQICGIRLILC